MAGTRYFILLEQELSSKSSKPGGSCPCVGKALGTCLLFRPISELHQDLQTEVILNQE